MTLSGSRCILYIRYMKKKIICLLLPVDNVYIFRRKQGILQKSQVDLAWLPQFKQITHTLWTLYLLYIIYVSSNNLFSVFRQVLFLYGFFYIQVPYWCLKHINNMFSTHIIKCMDAVVLGYIRFVIPYWPSSEELNKQT